MHFGIDVVSQYLRRKRPKGQITSLYYGLQSAYALGEVFFALMALLALSQGANVVGGWPGLSISLAAGAGWLSICIFFIEYRQPRLVAVIFIVAAIVTSRPWFTG